MPAAQPMPKKHLAAIRDAQSELKCLAQRLRYVLEGLGVTSRPATDTLKGTLQELQSDCYAVALRLSEIEFADGCDRCPCAPARTSAEIHLALVHQKLRCQRRKTNIDLCAQMCCVFGESVANTLLSSRFTG